MRGLIFITMCFYKLQVRSRILLKKEGSSKQTEGPSVIIILLLIITTFKVCVI